MFWQAMLYTLFLQTVDDFFTHFDSICGPGQLDISLRKPDKKKERLEHSCVIFVRIAFQISSQIGDHQNQHELDIALSYENDSLCSYLIYSFHELKQGWLE